MLEGDLFAIGAAACWSVSVILMRVSGLQIPPLPLTFFKNCVALVCLVLALLWLGEDWMPELTRGEYGRLVISALLGISFADTMIAAALNRLGASLHALADCIYTPAMACVGFLMFREVPSVWEVIGGSLVVSGVFVGAAMTAEVKKPRDLWMGFVLAAGAHIIMAVGILMVRDVFRETSLVWVTGFRFVVATLGLLVWAAVKFPKSMRKELFLGFFRPDTWRTMIPMAIFGPFAATLFWVAGFKHLEVGRAAIFNQLSTVFIILMAYVFLKERFTRRKALGTVLALGGAVLVAAHSPSTAEESRGDGLLEEGGMVGVALRESSLRDGDFQGRWNRGINPPAIMKGPAGTGREERNVRLTDLCIRMRVEAPGYHERSCWDRESGQKKPPGLGRRGGF